MKEFLIKHDYRKTVLRCCYAVLITYGLVALILGYPSPIWNLYDRFLAGAIFGTEKDCILLICFSAFILVLVVSLFIKQCLYKLISNAVFQLMCAIDICYCIKYYYIDGLSKISDAIEIAFDVIFIVLILFEILIMRKKVMRKKVS